MKRKLTKGEDSFWITGLSGLENQLLKLIYPHIKIWTHNTHMEMISEIFGN